MSESDSLGTSSASAGSGLEADPLASLWASMARTIPQSFTGVGQQHSMHSFGLAPTPPPMKEQLIIKCPICSESFREPKVLACFHSFCKSCLERQLVETIDKIVCPLCHVETQLSANLGIEGLLSDYGLENVVLRQNAANMDDKGLIFGSPSSTSSSPPLGELSCDQNSNQVSTCTGCKTGERASSFCHDCKHYLCSNCTMAHQYMHCFEGHRVEQLSLQAHEKNDGSHCKCLEHRSQPLRFFCLTCNLAICHDCTVMEHTSPTHVVQSIDDVAEKQMALMEVLIAEARNKQAELHEIFRVIDSCQNRLNGSLQRAQNNVDEAAALLTQLIQEARKTISKELEATFGYKQLQLTLMDKEVQKMTKKMSQTIEFTQRLIKYSSPTEVMVFKPLLDSRLQGFLNFNADANNLLNTPCEIDLQPLNQLQARQAVCALMNSLRNPDSWSSMNGNGSPSNHMNQPTPIGRPPSRQMRSPINVGSYISDNLMNGSSQSLGYPVMNMNTTGLSNNLNANSISGLMGTSAPVNSNAFGAHLNENSATAHIFNQYEKWSGNGLDQAFNGMHLSSPDMDKQNLSDGQDLSGAQSLPYPLYPPRSQIKRQKMIYHCKFGEFGVMEGQFTEPSGVAVNAQNDIVVADTNNHRIQVFDKEGRFKFQFGECGKRDGQLLYPNRVSVNRVTGDFIVTERSPTHQIQIYNQYGQFLRKFGANILQHPRGVCVDSQGRIIVVECKVSFGCFVSKNCFIFEAKKLIFAISCETI
jgi:tripartite motif-containing protein 2/3